MQSVREYYCNFFPSVCCLPLLFTLSCFAPLTSHVTTTKGHRTCYVSCVEGLVACYIPPRTVRCPKHVWHALNTSRNARWKKENRAKGRRGKKNCSNTFVHLDKGRNSSTYPQVWMVYNFDQLILSPLLFLLAFVVLGVCCFSVCECLPRRCCSGFVPWISFRVCSKVQLVSGSHCVETICALWERERERESDGGEGGSKW